MRLPPRSPGRDSHVPAASFANPSFLDSDRACWASRCGIPGHWPLLGGRCGVEQLDERILVTLVEHRRGGEHALPGPNAGVLGYLDVHRLLLRVMDGVTSKRGGFVRHR